MTLKVGIYSPCRNEEKHVNDWYESCKEADYIYVADTGSTDNTIQLLKERGVVVTNVSIQGWRFDLAFNIAMCFNTGCMIKYVSPSEFCTPNFSSCNKLLFKISITIIIKFIQTTNRCILK